MVACVGSHSTRGMYDEQFGLLRGKTELAQKMHNLDKSFTYLGLLFAAIILAAGIGIQII